MPFITRSEEILAELIIASQATSEEDSKAHIWYWWNRLDNISSTPRLYPISLTGLSRAEIAAYFEKHQDNELAMVRFDEHGHPSHLVVPLKQILRHLDDFLEYIRVHFPELDENGPMLRQLFKRGEFRAYQLEPEAYWQTRNDALQNLDEQLRMEREQQQAGLREFWNMMESGKSEDSEALSEAATLMQTIQGFPKEEVNSREPESTILQKPGRASLTINKDTPGISR
jgi:hypothetical protein